MVLPGSLRLRSLLLRRFSPTGRARELKPFFGLDPICSEVPGPRFCALGVPCPPPRCDGPKEQGPWKYLPGPKTASTPAGVGDLQNQGDPAELQIPIAGAGTRLDFFQALRHRRSGRERPDHLGGMPVATYRSSVGGCQT